MNRQNFFFLVALLFVCNTLFAQTAGGIPVELKPWNPPIKPPIGGIIPIDSGLVLSPNSIGDYISFSCYKESSCLTLQCNEDERVEVVIYEMLSGVKYTTTLNMVAGEVYTIDTPWGAGLYTIRLTQTDGTILEGDFQIK